MKKQSRTSRGSKQLTAIQTSRHFRVSHRKHSGRLLPRQHTSYPMLVMIVLCVGVLLGSWTKFVSAGSFVYPGPQQGSYDVTTRVPGPPPTIAASIDRPLDGDVFTDVPITVSGTCPTDTYVAILRNNTFSGVGFCQANNTYSVKTSLYTGINKLVAQVYSRTDVPGPASNMVSVTYSPPQPPPVVTPDTPPISTGDSGSKRPTTSNPTGTTPKQTSKTPARQTTPAPPANPFIIKTDFKYQGVYTGQPTDWQLSIEGGTAPYAMSVDWGDGTNSVESRKSSGAFALRHTFKQAGKYKGTYTATFTASDADGNKTYLQLVTVVNDPPHGVALGPTNTDSSGFGGSPAYLQKLLHYVWPGYGVVLLMLLSFWLGERREFRYLKPQLKKHRHRHA
jgi:hypothetical protein